MRIKSTIKDMKVVAVLVKNLVSGGAEKQAFLLAKALSTAYDSHLIVWNGSVVDDKFRAQFADSGINIHLVMGGAIARMRGVCALIKSLRPEVIFSSLTAANAFAAIIGKMYSIPVVTSLRCTWFPRHKMIAERFVTNHLVALTVPNSHTGKEIFAKAGFKADRLEVVSNCFENIKEYEPKESHDEIKVISVGRFVPEKDYGTAIAAMAQAMKQVPTLRYDIVGYGALEEQIRKQVEEHGIGDKVRILINPSNIPQLLDEADIYLSTSSSEGTSNAILEAMNADLPVVATRVGDNDRLVCEGVNGFLHSVGDAESIAASVVKLAQDEPARVKMGEASKRHLADTFSVETFTARYDAIVKRLTK